MPRDQGEFVDGGMLNGHRRRSEDVGGARSRWTWGPVQELESCLKGNGELLNDHTSAVRDTEVAPLS